MTLHLIPVSETYEALLAGVRKTAVMRACMVLTEDFFYFWKLFRSDRILWLGRLLCMNASLAQGFSCVQKLFARLTLKGFQMNTVHMRMKLIRNSLNFKKNFFYHTVNKGNEVHHPLRCCFLWRTWFLFCTYDCRNLGRDVARQALFLRSRSHQWMACCFHFHLGKNIHYTRPSYCRHLHL